MNSLFILFSLLLIGSSPVFAIKPKCDPLLVKILEPGHPRKQSKQFIQAMEKRVSGNDDFSVFNNFNDGMNVAISWLKDRGYSQPMEKWTIGKLSLKYGGTIPNSFEIESSNGEKIKVRIERHALERFDKQEWNHINVSFGSEEAPHLLFPGNRKDLETILKRLFVR